MKRARFPDGPRMPIDLARFQFPHPGWYTVHDCFCDYSRERLINKGKDCFRAWIGFNNFCRIVPPEQDVTAVTTGQVEDYVDWRMQSTRAASRLTPKRELALIGAAIRYAHRRNRIKLVPYIELPDEPHKMRRPLTEEEFRLVISKPMTPRLRRFYWVAYFTGHRAGAIEELEWDRVDLVKRTINFNVPGRIVTTKKRNGAFPIIDEFLAKLTQWKAAAKDKYVISAGSSTYKEAQHIVRDLCGIKDPSLVPRHCMRKKFATDLFEREVDPEVAGFLLADDPNTLRAHYVTFKDSTLRAAVNKLRA